MTKQGSKRKVPLSAAVVMIFVLSLGVFIIGVLMLVERARRWLYKVISCE